MCFPFCVIFDFQKLFQIILEPKTEKACATVKYENSASAVRWKSKQCDHDKYYVCQYTVMSVQLASAEILALPVK